MIKLRWFGVSISLLCACGSSATDSPNSGGASGVPSGGMATAGTSPSSSGAPSSGSSSVGAGGMPGNAAGAPATSGAGAGGVKPNGGAAMTGGNAGVATNGGVATSGGSAGASSGSCTREALDAAAESYVAAVVAGDPTMLMLASGATNLENTKTVAIADGVLKTALPVAFHRNLLDVEQCESFSEIIVTEGGHPYVLGAHLKVTSGSISAIDTLVTDQGDWLFDAAGYLKHSKAEDWALLPTDKQISRDALIAAANSYFDLFNDKSIVVPWGTPCNRLEGGSAYTNDTCDVGVPDGVTFANKHFVVDIPMGTSVGIVRFGGANGLPDSHMFRVPGGKIRYVHTITVCDPKCM